MPSEFSQHEIRQRRARFVQSMNQEEQEMNEIKNMIKKSQASNTYFLKLSLVVGTAIVVTIVALLHQFRPSLFYGKKIRGKPFRFASVYTGDIVLQRDLPRFFRSYTIATPENKVARMAVARSARSRNSMRETSEIKLKYHTYDAFGVDTLLDQQGCGQDFNEIYYSSSDKRKADMFMWCLLASKRVEAFLLDSVQMIQSPLSLTKGRGIVVRSSFDPENRLSNAFYIHPRKLVNKQSTMNAIPRKVIVWLLDHPETDQTSYEEYEGMMQAYINDLVYSEGGEENFIFLDEICQPYRPSRTIAEKCEDESCCYFVLPEKYKAFFFDEDSSDE